MLKTGTRLQSQVCDTQIIVAKTSDDLTNFAVAGRLYYRSVRATLDRVNEQWLISGFEPICQ